MKILLGIFIGAVITLIIGYLIIKYLFNDTCSDILKFILDLPNHF